MQKANLMDEGITFYCKNGEEKERLKEVLLKEKLRMIENYSNQIKEEEVKYGKKKTHSVEQTR